MPLFSILLMIALAVIWGASYLFIKILLVDMGPSAINAMRCLIGAVVLWIAVWVRRVPLPRKVTTWASLMLVAVVGIVLPFSAIVWGTQHIASGMSAILVATMPIFTYLLVLALIAVKYFTPVMLVVLLAIPSLRQVIPPLLKPKPAEKPEDFPEGEGGWPLYFAPIAFLNNRSFGTWFMLGLLVDVILRNLLPEFWI